MDQSKQLSILRDRIVVLACYFLSGFTALIYEICWLQKVQLTLGFSIYSHSMTLATYLAGLGCGSMLSLYLLKQQQQNFVRIYLWAELAIAGFALIFYPLLSWMDSKYALFFILVPTTLMGLTLPLLTQFLTTQNQKPSQNFTQLYLVNTLGALLGAFFTGYIFLPFWGQQNTVYVAVGLTLILFLIGFIFISKEKNQVEKPALVNFLTWKNIFPGRKFYLSLLFLSGVLSLVSQIIWHRLGSLVLGPSVYILPLVTGVMLLGICLGFFLQSKDILKSKNRGSTLILVGLLFHAGNSALSLVPAVLPILFQFGMKGFFDLQVLEFLLLCGCLLPGAIGLGALFPISLMALIESTEAPVAVVAIGYFINICGLFFGALVAANFLLPKLGIENLSKLSASFLITLGSAVWIAGDRRKSMVGGLAAGSFLILFLIPSFDRELLTSGIFYNKFTVVGNEKKTMSPHELFSYSRKYLTIPFVDYEDDPLATVSIHVATEPGKPDIKFFRINGKNDGSTLETDQVTTRLLAWFPLLLNADTESMLTIGLGTGLSAALPARWYPHLKKSVIAEMSPAMVQFSKKYFYDFSAQLFTDPKVKIEIRDGREYLQHTAEKFDLILSEPSNPWMNGVGNLYTKEFFELTKDHLTSGGIAEFWFHTYSMDCAVVDSVLATIQSVFPSVFVFHVGGDLFFLASQEIKRTRLVSIPGSMKDVEREFFILLGADPTQAREYNYSFMLEKSLILTSAEIKARTKDIQLITDDNQRLQYEAGRIFWRSDNSCVVDKGFRIWLGDKPSVFLQ